MANEAPSFKVQPVKSPLPTNTGTSDGNPLRRHKPGPDPLWSLPPALALLTALLGLSVLSTFCSAAELHPGSEIFRKQCASCHGAEGQGVAGEYDEPLQGSRSLSSLTRLIERTMPEDTPESCVGEDARQVAEFIFQEFYSTEARKKKGLLPPIEIARLTVPQYRNVVADLLGRFTPVPGGGKRDAATDQDPAVQPGLSAQYFQSEGMSKADKLKLERVDPNIDFDFAEGSPGADITPDQFAIIWEGALSAPDTGHYEFRVKTPNGTRLYVNRDNTGTRGKLRDDSSAAGQAALIDAWVSSGELQEHTARVFLLGGRQYPLRLEFFKYKEKASSIRLEWKPPRGTWAPLDQRHVSTARVPRTFVVETPFPADDRSLGYERGSSISREWQTATVNAAIATAAETVARLPLLAGFKDGAGDRDDPIREFLARFAAAAYRRPLSTKETELFREVLFTGATNPESAVRRAVILILTSPHFLYTDLTPQNEAPDQYTIASRLALALWDSIPDPALSDAAGQNQLGTPEQIEAQARRMLANPRTHEKIRSFFHQWLEIEERDLAKDREMFPEFDESVVADLRHSLDLFLEQVVWSDRSDYRELLLADYLLLNQRLRKIYDPAVSSPPAVAGPENTDPAESDETHSPATTPPDSFEPVVFAPGRRAGILTHPYLLSAFAYHNNSSPIHRGVFLTRNIVGRRLKPPPMAVAFKNEDFPADISMREKITRLTRDKACMSCHSVINPLGFALENYDAVGRWRTRENNLPVDSASAYVTDQGDTVQIQSARDIANLALGHESAERAFVTQLFHHLIHQPPAAYGLDTAEELGDQFRAKDFDIQNLIATIAVISAGHGIQASNATTESK